MADVFLAFAMNGRRFVKMSGGGNDFVLLDNRESWFPRTGKELVVSLCRRGTGIGADAVLLLENTGDADLRMVYYNADGGRAPMCGNGAMCIARYARRTALVSSADVRVATDAGILRARVEDPAKPKVTLWLRPPSGLAERIELEAGPSYGHIGFVDTTTPHVVAVVPDVVSIDTAREGRRIRDDPRFAPGGTNVNFVEIVDLHTVRMRTYERGVEAETLSCGTGAVAAAILAVRWGLAHAPVRVCPRGGYPLDVELDASATSGQPRLTGHARIVYEGVIEELPTVDSPSGDG